MAGRSTPKPTGRTVELRAVEPVKCGGKRHEPGDAFFAPESVAEDIVDLGAAEPVQPLLEPAEPPAP
jgi:hypothetical protein